jgi:transcriptional regulator with XRE-family HTH domain
MKGKELAAIRELHHLSQPKLAEKLNISLKTVKNWEKMEEIYPKKVLLIKEIFKEYFDRLEEKTFQNDQNIITMLISSKESEIESLKRVIESKDELICCLKKMIFLNEDQKKRRNNNESCSRNRRTIRAEA